MNTGPEIDMSRLENSETPESIREETKALLMEARSIVEMSAGSEKEEDFRREYNELAEEYNARFEDGVIDTSDLHALRQELSEVQEGREISGAEHFILDYIRSTNQDIISGDERALEENLTWYADVFGGNTGLNPVKIGARRYIMSQEGLSEERMLAYHDRIQTLQNSTESKYSRLLQLSQIIYDVSMEGGLGGGIMESAHNNATRELVKQVIENSDDSIVVGYTRERGYYTVESKDIDTSNDMEVGTFLCSLNKSGNLTLDNLVRPNGPFEPLNIPGIINRYEEGEFGGPEVAGLFVGYLDGFSVAMHEIEREYMRRESDGNKQIQFINAQNEVGYLEAAFYGPDEIRRLSELTQDLDISVIENHEIQEQILLSRRVQAGERIIEELSDLYAGGPDVISTVRALVEMSVNGHSDEFDYIGLNAIIGEFNEQQGENDALYPLFEGELLVIFETSLSSIMDASIAAEGFTDRLDRLSEVQEEGQKILEELRGLQNRLFGESDPVKIQEIQLQIQTLKHRSFLISEEIIDTQESLDEAQDVAEEAIGESEEFARNFASGLLSEMSYDFENPLVVEDFDNNPEKLSLVTNKEELLKYLETTENHISLSQIHRNHWGDLEILPKIRQISSNELYLIPESFFQVTQEDSGYSKMNVLLKNSWANAGDILRRFQNTNLGIEPRLAEACFYLLGDDGISDIDKRHIKEYVENSILITLFSPERREQYDLKVNVETDPDIALEVFRNTFSSMRRRGNIPSQSDIEVYKNYLDVHGCFEVMSHYASLVINPRIGFQTIRGCISSIPYDSEHIIDGEIVSNGIEHRGLDFLRLLREEYKENPTIIKKGIISCKNNSERKQFISMLTIDSPAKLTALYEGLEHVAADSNSTIENSGVLLLRELFWNEITPMELEALRGQVDPRGESIESRITLMIINAIEQEMNQRQEYLVDTSNDYQEVIREGKEESYIGTIRSILQENGVPESLFENEIQPHLTGYLEGSEEDERKIYRAILSHSEINNEQALEIMKMISEIKIEELDARITTRVETMTESLSSYPREFQDLLSRSISGEIKSEDIKALMEGLFYRYIHENIEAFATGDIETQKTIFISNLLLRYGFSDGQFQEQTETLEEIFESLSEIEITRHKRENPDLWQKFLEDSSPETRRELYEAIGEQMGTEAQTRLQEIQARYPHIQNIPSIENNSKGNNYQSNQENSSSDIQETYSEITTTLGLTQEEAGSLTTEELELISSSEVVKESFINFRNTLTKLGLENIWQFRNQIFTAIGSLDFNIADGNYIGENELNIFLSKVVYATTGDERLRVTPSNLDETERVIRELNRVDGFSGQEDVSYIGEGGGVIETSFREKFAPRDEGLIGFKFAAFKEALRQ